MKISEEDLAAASRLSDLAIQAAMEAENKITSEGQQNCANISIAMSLAALTRIVVSVIDAANKEIAD